MRNSLRSAVIWIFLLGSPLGAADPVVTLPAEVRCQPGRLLQIRAESQGKVIRWVSASADADLIASESGRWAIFSAPQPGVYRVLAWTALGDVPSEAAICTITVGKPPVPPVPPVPPGPVPPAPPFPIPGVGFRALIIYETADLEKLPRPQVLVLYSATVREYLNARCALGPDGKTREWRLWDQNVSTVGESPSWQEAMKLPHSSTPWIILNNAAKGGYSGPLPGTVEETMALLKQWGE